MKKLLGLHFYINISNLNSLIENEEKYTGKVNHSIHALDTFFTSIERYGKDKYLESFVIEKITGSRLHMYILRNIKDSFAIMSDITRYAYELSLFLVNSIGKYQNLNVFKLQVGADYGYFYNFIFKQNEYEEETTIGYAANYAAKLQSLSENSYASISLDIFNNLDESNRSAFELVTSDSIEKYNQSYYATSKIIELNNTNNYLDYFEIAKEYANKINLKDIEYSNVKTNISFENLSKSYCKKFVGISFFSDVRGFTAQFNKDDSNLNEMSIKTQETLETMYNVVKQYNGTHIQFQGDREMALFCPTNNSDDYIINAILTALKIIDGVKNINLNVGIGQAHGLLFASRIGARGEKDNILIGSTVNDADEFEDKYADKNQVVISNEIYDSLKDKKSIYIKYFEKINNKCYRITIGYSELDRMVRNERLIKNTKSNNYNGAWLKDRNV